MTASPCGRGSPVSLILPPASTTAEQHQNHPKEQTYHSRQHQPHNRAKLGMGPRPSSIVINLILHDSPSYEIGDCDD